MLLCLLSGSMSMGSQYREPRKPNQRAADRCRSTVPSLRGPMRGLMATDPPLAQLGPHDL